MGNTATRRLTGDVNSLPSSPESECLSSSTQEESDRSQQSLSSIRLEPLTTSSTKTKKRKPAATERNLHSNRGDVTLPPMEWPDFSSGKVLPFKEYKKWLTNFRNREQVNQRRPMIRCKTATFRISRSPRKEEFRSDGKVFVVDEERKRRTENRLDLTAINHAMTQPRNKIVPVAQLNVRQLKPCHWFDNPTADASNTTIAVIKHTRSSALSSDLNFENHEVSKKRPPTHLSPIMARKSL